MEQQAIVVENLVKEYPRVKAVNGVSFSVAKGEIFGLLGPNGAGKTTTIRTLLTLIKPTSGKVTMFDVDVTRNSETIRRMSGYVPQDVSADGELTAYENVLIYAKLYDMPRQERKKRIMDVLGYLQIKERANDMVNTYSGGMMRRLEIAQALVNRPKVLFLDEPSIGLDPNARRIIWELINRLRNEFGTTIFLTTHDMNEADILCDRIGIMNKGMLATLDTPEKLKSSVGGDVISIGSPAQDCARKVKEMGYNIISSAQNNQCDIVVENGEATIPLLLGKLNAGGIKVESVSLKKPTLDDAFLKYTGSRIEADQGDTFQSAKRARTAFRRFTQ
ncbi:MAG TPA: ATP-binding cassette domain-containing protein [Dehalococcoidales bacterium]|nr:ATP-binding cassette domain-containing protein [Dehalococcoidales bacterium]